ncbi:MAG TPA: hypothetical protein VNS09_20440, partial [Solirubrobacter sp.]|nr:hypothetical protein [Solirubrobacter sp.]
RSPQRGACEHSPWRAFLRRLPADGLDQPGRYAAFFIGRIHNFWSYLNAYLRHVSPAGVPDHSPIRLSQRPAGVPRRYNGQSGPPAFCVLSPGRIFAMWGETWDHLGHHDSDPRDVPTQTRLSGSYAQMFDGDGRMLGGDRRRKRSMPEYTNGNLIPEPVGGTCVDLRADNDAPGAHRRYQLMLRTLNRTGRPGPTHVVTTYARGVEPHDVVVTWSAGRGLVFEARVRLSSPSDVGPGLYVTPLK